MGWIKRSSLLFCALLLSCSGNDDDTARCVPGRMVPCACPNGQGGSQQCGSDGTYQSCVCESDDAGATDGAIDGGALDLGIDAGILDADPSDAQPDAEPIDADPIDADPIDADPIDADPIDADPIDAAPIDAEPSDTDADPIDAEPSDADPIDADPVDADSVDAEASDAAQEDAAPISDAAVDAGTIDSGTLDSGILDMGTSSDVGSSDADGIDASVDGGFADGTVQSPCTNVIGPPTFQPDFAQGVRESAWIPEALGRLVAVGNDVYFDARIDGVWALYRYSPQNKTLENLGSTLGSLVHHNGRVYGGGTSNLVYYDIATDTWTAMVGTPNTFSDAVVVGDTIYFVGAFTSILGFPAGYIAAYDTVAQSWDFLNGGVDSEIDVVEEVDGTIYVSGDRITSAGGAPADTLAAWDPLTRSWSALGTTPSELRREVLGLFGFNGNLIVWDDSYSIDLMMWDPVAQAWSDPGWPPLNAVIDFNGDLYIAGIRLRRVNGTTVNFIAQFDPQTGTGTPLGNGWRVGLWGYPAPNLARVGDRIFVSGSGSGVGPLLYSPAVAQWIPSLGEWSQGFAKPTGGDERVDATIDTIGLVGCDLYVTGMNLARTGNVIAYGLSRWDATMQEWQGVNPSPWKCHGAPGDLHAADARDLFVSSNTWGSCMYLSRYDLATETWHRYGQLGRTRIKAVELSGDDAYILDSQSQIWHLDRNTDVMTAVSTPIAGGANTMALDGDYIYLTGDFTWVYGMLLNYFGRLYLPTETYEELSPKGSPNKPTTPMNHIEVGPQAIFFGRYDQSGDAVDVRSWDTVSQTWSDHSIAANPAQANPLLKEMLYHDGFLYLAGAFRIPAFGGGNTGGIMKLNLSTDQWENIGKGAGGGGGVWGIATNGTDIWIGGHNNNTYSYYPFDSPYLLRYGP